MIDKRGFTLTELLAVLVVIGIIFGVTIYIIRGTTATTLTQIENISDNEVYDSAKLFVLEGNKSFKNDYVCVSTNELFDYGYLKTSVGDNKIIKIIRNNKTKVIEEIKYVDICN